MPSTTFLTAGDSKVHVLGEKGFRNDRGLYEVTLVCPDHLIGGAVNTQSFAAGEDGLPVLELSPGDSITFLTRNIHAICWQDGGTVATVVILIQRPTVYILPGEQQTDQKSKQV